MCVCVNESGHVFGVMRIEEGTYSSLEYASVIVLILVLLLCRGVGEDSVDTTVSKESVVVGVPDWC